DDIHHLLLERLDQAGITYNYQPNFSRTDSEDVIGKYSGLIIRSKFQVDQAFLDKATNLQFIARPGAGMDNIDEAYAAKKGIRNFSEKYANKNSVGEHMIGMLLTIMKNLNRAHREVYNAQGRREENRRYELKGRTVALIEYGHNGEAMAKKLVGFEVN